MTLRISVFILTAILCLSVVKADDHTVVYLVRHAEKMLGQDPELTEKGLHRAGHYADMFRDSGITAIYSTQTKRTETTARPLAKVLNLEIIAYDPENLEELAAMIRKDGGAYFVSGHSDTTPALVHALGGDPGSDINEKNEFDRIYQVIITSDDKVYTQRLRSLPPPSAPSKDK